MVNQRKEPTVSSVLTSNEDLADGRSRRSKTGGDRTQPQVVVQKTSSFWVFLALLIALAAAGAAGYSYWLLMQAQVSLGAQQARIAQLEQRLSLSDDESSQSLTAVSAKVKESESEIRKLWGVAHDTNRKAIATNKKATDTNKKALASVQTKRIAPLSKQVKTQQASLTALTGNVKAVKGSVAEQELLIQSLRERVAEQNQSVKRVVADGQRINKKIDALGGVDKRIKTNEEAIAAFDAFRRTVSRDLLQLKQRANSAPPAAAPKP